MSKAVSIIMAQSWPLGSHIADKKILKKIKASVLQGYNFFQIWWITEGLKNFQILSLYLCFLTEKVVFPISHAAYGCLWLNIHSENANLNKMKGKMLINFKFKFNPSRPAHFPAHKINIELNFYFRTSLWCLKRFDEGL